MLSEDHQVQIFKLSTIIQQMNDVKDHDKQEIQNMSKKCDSLNAEINKLNDNIFDMNQKINLLKNSNNEMVTLNHNLETKVETLKKKEEYFKNEIKKNILELQAVKAPLDEYESMKEQIEIDAKDADKYRKISSQCKELVWNFGGSNKRVSIQTDITQD